MFVDAYDDARRQKVAPEQKAKRILQVPCHHTVKRNGTNCYDRNVLPSKKYDVNIGESSNKNNLLMW